MTIRRTFAIAAILGTLSITNIGIAQDSEIKPNKAESPEKNESDGIDRIKLFDSLEQPSIHNSRSQSNSISGVETNLRQARAIERSNQRIARMERASWLGYDPLRPGFNSVPMMQSRYAPPRYYVPVFIYAR